MQQSYPAHPPSSREAVVALPQYAPPTAPPKPTIAQMVLLDSRSDVAATIAGTTWKFTVNTSDMARRTATSVRLVDVDVADTQRLIEPAWSELAWLPGLEVQDSCRRMEVTEIGTDALGRTLELVLPLPFAAVKSVQPDVSRPGAVHVVMYTQPPRPIKTIAARWRTLGSALYPGADWSSMDETVPASLALVGAIVPPIQGRLVLLPDTVEDYAPQGPNAFTVLNRPLWDYLMQGEGLPLQLALTAGRPPSPEFLVHTLDAVTRDIGLHLMYDPATDSIQTSYYGTWNMVGAKVSSTSLATWFGMANVMVAASASTEPGTTPPLYRQTAADAVVRLAPGTPPGGASGIADVATAAFAASQWPAWSLVITVAGDLVPNTIALPPGVWLPQKCAAVYTSLLYQYSVANPGFPVLTAAFTPAGFVLASQDQSTSAPLWSLDTTDPVAVPQRVLDGLGLDAGVSAYARVVRSVRPPTPFAVVWPLGGGTFCAPPPGVVQVTSQPVAGVPTAVFRSLPYPSYTGHVTGEFPVPGLLLALNADGFVTETVGDVLRIEFQSDFTFATVAAVEVGPDDAPPTIVVAVWTWQTWDPAAWEEGAVVRVTPVTSWPLTLLCAPRTLPDAHLPLDVLGLAPLVVCAPPPTGVITAPFSMRVLPDNQMYIRVALGTDPWLPKVLAVGMRRGEEALFAKLFRSSCALKSDVVRDFSIALPTTMGQTFTQIRVEVLTRWMKPYATHGHPVSITLEFAMVDVEPVAFLGGAMSIPLTTG